MKKAYYLKPQVKIFNFEIEEGLLALSVGVGESVNVTGEGEVGADGPTNSEMFFEDF